MLIATCMFLLLLQAAPLTRAILEAEDARSADLQAIEQGLRSADARILRIAVRALGRLERSSLAEMVLPFLSAPEPEVRVEAVTALGRMGATPDLAAVLEREQDPQVRGVVLATMGRLPRAREEVLARGLGEASPDARAGAARGLEAYFRLNSGKVKPSAATIELLRRSFSDNESAVFRELVLLTLNAAGDADPATLALALRDPEPQVRRLAVIGSRQWKDDPAPMVRYEALRVAGDCERAAAAVRDPSPYVALLAIDLLGRGCEAGILEPIADDPRDWRRQSRALVALAKVKPESARMRLRALSRHPVWQARAYAAEAARTVGDSATLSELLRDENPNVVAAALDSPADASRVLGTSHHGLIMRAAGLMRGWRDGRSAVPALLAALHRLTHHGKDTSRDPRRSILERLSEFGDEAMLPSLEPLRSDFDPVIARLAARIAVEKGGPAAPAATGRMRTRPAPPQPFIDGLQGARATVRMREAGDFTLELLPDEAPVTAAGFAQLAESGYYNGLTFHRIVPNFVIQGGSPGANEYDGAPHYLRDELGLRSHLRGTVGISTRGRDTGDSQIFVNLVDNFRLDHNYTVFARITDGMDRVDRIQEGDAIESVRIIRRVTPE